jgi:hypothetical protein
MEQPGVELGKALSLAADLEAGTAAQAQLRVKRLDANILYSMRGTRTHRMGAPGQASATLAGRAAASQGGFACLPLRLSTKAGIFARRAWAALEVSTAARPAASRLVHPTARHARVFTT